MTAGLQALAMAHYAPLVLLLLLVVTCVLEAQPDGWAMTDRFYGFRYEMIVNDAEKDVDSANKYIEMIQMEADRRNCFGWVQQPNKLRIVGEVRCAKPKGEDIVQWFRDLRGSIIDDVKVLVYPDTKIRLHFSHFKVLDSNRDTCFLDEPHKCVDLTNHNTEQGTNSPPPNLSKEEL